jgi:hypothetical protein
MFGATGFSSPKPSVVMFLAGRPLFFTNHRFTGNCWMTAPTLSNAASASGRISAFPKSNNTSACKLMLIACAVSWYLSATLSFSSSARFFWRSSSVCLTSFFLISSSFSVCVGVVASCCPRAAPTTKKTERLRRRWPRSARPALLVCQRSYYLRIGARRRLVRFAK